VFLFAVSNGNVDSNSNNYNIENEVNTICNGNIAVVIILEFMAIVTIMEVESGRAVNTAFSVTAIIVLMTIMAMIAAKPVNQFNAVVEIKTERVINTAFSAIAIIAMMQMITVIAVYTAYPINAIIIIIMSEMALITVFLITAITLIISVITTIAAKSVQKISSVMKLLLRKAVIASLPISAITAIITTKSIFTINVINNIFNHLIFKFLSI